MGIVRQSKRKLRQGNDNLVQIHKKIFQSGKINEVLILKEV